MTLRRAVNRKEGFVAEKKQITIYTTQTWPWCHRAKEYLSKKGIAFTEHDVGKDQGKAREMISKSGQMGVPVIVVGEQIIIGFNQKALDEALAK